MLKVFFKYAYKPQKVQFQLTNKIAYVLETSNTYKTAPCAFGFYKLSEISGTYYRDIGQREYENCRNDCIVFKGTNCNNNKLNCDIEFKAEAK